MTDHGGPRAPSADRLNEHAVDGQAVEQGDEADKVRAGKGAAALAAYPPCSVDQLKVHVTDVARRAGTPPPAALRRSAQRKRAGSVAMDRARVKRPSPANPRSAARSLNGPLIPPGDGSFPRTTVCSQWRRAVGPTRLALGVAEADDASLSSEAPALQPSWSRTWRQGLRNASLFSEASGSLQAQAMPAWGPAGGADRPPCTAPLAVALPRQSGGARLG
jgi:hypothetical protein